MKRILARAALTVFLVLVVAYSLFPFFWMVVTSVKTEREVHTVRRPLGGGALRRRQPLHGPPSGLAQLDRRPSEPRHAHPALSTRRQRPSRG